MTTTIKLQVGQVEAGAQLTSGSMAEAIYEALKAQVPLGVAEDPLPRQKLAIAIAAGVIDHLKAREQAFVVNVRDTSTGAAIERTVRIDVG